MHVAVLAEDSSGKHLLDHLMPKLIGPHGEPHTWELHAYRGIGRIPPGLVAPVDSAKRLLLNQLPKLLRGYARTPGYDAVVVVLDADTRDRAAFLAELQRLAIDCGAADLAMFRLAIEETEAWYLGDQIALLTAYPSARRQLLAAYVQDSICGTWERLTDIIHPGGLKAVQKAGWPMPGTLKHEWAHKIGPLMEPDRDVSPGFGKLRDGLRRLAQG